MTTLIYIFIFDKDMKILKLGRHVLPGVWAGYHRLGVASPWY